ncbi:hypothetical protein C8R44DRAFT_724813 [Mycena epipterygia]|nr:hypothetical protein C8R44DRAFT_724813 [Mycena epipterygia]
MFRTTSTGGDTYPTRLLRFPRPVGLSETALYWSRIAFLFEYAYKNTPRGPEIERTENPDAKKPRCKISLAADRFEEEVANEHASWDEFDKNYPKSEQLIESTDSLTGIHPNTPSRNYFGVKGLDKNPAKIEHMMKGTFTDRSFVFDIPFREYYAEGWNLRDLGPWPAATHLLSSHLEDAPKKKFRTAAKIVTYRSRARVKPSTSSNVEEPTECSSRSKKRNATSGIIM